MLIFSMLVLLLCSVTFATDTLNATDTHIEDTIIENNAHNDVSVIDEDTSYYTEDILNEELDYNLSEDLSTLNEYDYEENISKIRQPRKVVSNSVTIKHVYVNPNANVNNQDGTSAHPYKTIKSAMTKTMNDKNVIIHLSPGNHILNEKMKINKSITFVGDNKYNTNISCFFNQAFSVDGSYLKLEKIKVQNAQSSKGGVFVANSNTKLVINDCIFTKNKADTGMVLFCSGDNVKSNITNTRFEYNTGLRYGALQIGGSTSLFNIRNCVFTNNILTTKNYAESNGGAAIYAGTYSHVNIYNSVFSNNKALWGNAILNGNHATTKLYNCNFTNNIAEQSADGINKTKGGAIGVGSGYVEINSCYFKNNKADVGGAISINSGESSLIQNSVFHQNIAFIQGGAINNYGKLTVKNSKFTKNNATRRGGAILDIGKNDILIQNCSFVDNKVLTSKLGSTSKVPQGGAISISGECNNLTVKNSVFNHNNAYYAGAIYTEISVHKVIIQNTVFHNNTAHFGGAIIISGMTTLDTNNVSFKYNRALKQGGAILLNGTVEGSFYYTQFLNNNASVSNSGYGGVFYINENHNLNFVNCNFNGNQANLKGGVICSMSVGRISISGSNITNNKATTASVIYLDNSKNYKSHITQIKIDTSTVIGNVGNYVLYSVKTYDETWNNNLIKTSWFGSNVLPNKLAYNFKIQNQAVLTIIYDNNNIKGVSWVNNKISLTFNKTNKIKDLELSFKSIKEGNNIRLTDQFLPPRQFTYNNQNKILNIHYKLNTNLNKISLKMDNQIIEITVVS